MTVKKWTLVLLCTAALSHRVSGEPHQIVLKPFGIGPIVGGELVPLMGKERFNDGQLRNLKFFVNAQEIQYSSVSADKVYLFIPKDLATGDYQIRVIKHAEKQSMIEFAQTVHIVSGVETQIEEKTAQIGPGGGKLATSDLEIVLPPNDQRGEITLTLTEVTAPLPRKAFLTASQAYPLNKLGLPPVASERTFRIESSGDPLSQIIVRAKVADSFSTLIPAGFEPEIWYESVECGGDEGEELHEYAPLSADWLASAKQLVATLPADSLLYPCGEGVTASRMVANSIPVLRIEFRLATRKVTNLEGCINVNVIRPVSPDITVSRSDAVSLEASLDFKVPSPLTNPSSYPLPSSITSAFGVRQGVLHGGVDIRSRIGDPVFAAEAGTIEFVGTDVNAVQRSKPFRCSSGKVLTHYDKGFYVVLRHDDQTATRYIHLLDQSAAPGVTDGARVAAGQQIAQSSNSGSSCDPHLHFSYMVCSSRRDDVIDPQPWLTANTPTPAQYLKDWNVLVLINGQDVATTRQPIASQSFRYITSFPAAQLTNLAENVIYPLLLVLEDAKKNRQTLFHGTLKITPALTGNRQLRVEVTWSKPVNLVLMAEQMGGWWTLVWMANGVGGSNYAAIENSSVSLPPQPGGPMGIIIDNARSVYRFFVGAYCRDLPLTVTANVTFEGQPFAQWRELIHLADGDSCLGNDKRVYLGLFYKP